MARKLLYPTVYNNLGSDLKKLILFSRINKIDEKLSFNFPT